MGIVAIASYRPVPGRKEEFIRLLAGHIPMLRARGHVSNRPAYMLQSSDGTVLEVFEWLSEEAKDAAHRDEVVVELWNRFSGLAEFVALGSLPEASTPFANFENLAP